jgi:hypothetical protein
VRLVFLEVFFRLLENFQLLHWQILYYKSFLQAKAAYGRYIFVQQPICTIISVEIN